MDADDVADLIDSQAAKPASATNDMGTIQNRPLSELFELEDRKKRNTAAANPRRGLRVTRLIPPGTT